MSIQIFELLLQEKEENNVCQYPHSSAALPDHLTEGLCLLSRGSQQANTAMHNT